MDKTPTEASNPGADMLRVLLLLLLCMAIGVAFYQTVEGLSPVDALYFTAVTLTTVGYGDFAPQTDAGKIFTVFYAFIGIGIFLGFAGAIFRHALDKSYHLKSRKEKQE